MLKNNLNHIAVQLKLTKYGKQTILNASCNQTQHYCTLWNEIDIFTELLNPSLDFPFWYSTYETTNYIQPFFLSYACVFYVYCGGRQYNVLDQGLFFITLLMFWLSASSNMNLWIISDESVLLFQDDKSTFIMNKSLKF